VVYGGSYGGFLVRLNHATGELRAVNPWPDDPMGAAAGDLKYRFQWNFPMAFSPHDPRVLYAGANVLFKSTDEGQSWTVISPDLTRNDRSKQGPSGGPITKDNSSVEYYDTIFAVAESPVAAGVLWAGSDDGMVHVSRDGGAHWQDVTPPAGLGLPRWAQINSLEASPFEAGGAYFAATLYKSDDDQPYLFKTSDFGSHWTRIDDGIGRAHFTRVVRADPARRGLLYAGTQGGVYVSLDDGARWRPLQLNLPLVPVTDLTVKEGDLVAATEGRGFWVLDDLAPLRELAAEPRLVAAPSHLFTPRQVVRDAGGGAGPEAPKGRGQNPPAGLIVDYYLRDAPAAGQAPLRIEILDREGKLIRAFTAEKPGAEKAAKQAEAAKPGAAKTSQASGEAEAESAARPTRAESTPAAGEAGVAKGLAASPPTAAAPATGSKGQPAGAAGAAGAKPAAGAAAAGEKEEAAETAEGGEAGGGEAGESDLAALFREPEAEKPAAAQGLNRFVWDMTYRRARGFPGMVLWFRELTAPWAAPGAYHVRLVVDGKTAAPVPFTIVKDPRSSSSDADLEAQARFLLGIRDKLDVTHDALRRIRAVRAQIAELRKRLRAATHEEAGEAGAGTDGAAGEAGSGTGGAGKAPESDPYAAVRKAGKELDGKLAAVEETLYQTKSRSLEDALNYPIRLDDKLNGLAVLTALGDYRPTAQAIAVRDQLVAAIDAQLAKLAELLDHDLADFNRLAAGAGVQTVIPPRPQLK
jgi:hypothetical protein